MMRWLELVASLPAGRQAIGELSAKPALEAGFSFQVWMINNKEFGRAICFLQLSNIFVHFRAW